MLRPTRIIGYEFMKNFKFLTMMFVLVAMSLGFASCSDDDDNNDGPQNPTTSIVGNWQQINSAGTVITVQFRADRTGSVHYEYTNGNTETESIEYDYIESDRTITIIGDSQLNGYYTVTLTANILRLEFGTQYYQFTRI